MFSRRRFVQGSAAGALSLTLLSAWPGAPDARATESAASSLITGVSGDFASVPAGADLQRLVDLAYKLGARTIRFPVDWARVQPRPGIYDWSAYDDLHRELVWSGLQAVPVLINAPDWLEPDQLRSTPGGLRYPYGHGALNAFGDFAVETAFHFRHYIAAVRGLEVWSRPNGGELTLIEDPQAFACLVDTVALATSALLIPGQQISEPIEILAGALDMQGDKDWRPYADALLASPVAAEISLDYTAATDAAQLRDEIAGGTAAAAGQGERKLWLNLAAPAVGKRGDADWQALRELAAGQGMPNCRGITINPLHALVDRSGGAETAASYPEGEPLVEGDWRQGDAYEAIQDAWAQGANGG